MCKTIEEKLLHTIDKQKDDMVELLQRLIRFNTEAIEYGVGGNEGEAQKYIAKYLQDLGLKVDCFEPNNKKLKKYLDFVPGHDYKNRPNVVGVFSGKGKGRSLILNGHIDTVPAGSPELWKYPPYKGVVEKGKVYGRGASDMKGGLAVMLTLVDILVKSDIQLKNDLILESVVDEEGDGNGTLACCDRGYRADGAIVLDGPLKIETAHPGCAILRLEVRGKAGHCCRKFTKLGGVNAIDKMRILLNELEKFELERIARLKDTDYFPKVPVVSVGRIWGGDNASTVPESCTAEIVFDYFASEADKQGYCTDFCRKVEERIRNLENCDPWLKNHPSRLKWLAATMPAKIEQDHLLVKKLQQTARKVSRELEVVASDASSDARHFLKVGTPMVLMGAGEPSCSHAINEYVPINNLLSLAKILALFIVDWCGVA